MKDQTLDAIDKELVEAGEFLNEFTGEKLECIQQFCKCQEIVQWIHDTTKGLHRSVYCRHCTFYSPLQMWVISKTL